jgi:hypothetical protein
VVLDDRANAAGAQTALPDGASQDHVAGHVEGRNLPARLRTSSARCLGASSWGGTFTTRSTTESAVRPRSACLRGAPMCAYQRRDANDVDGRLPPAREACHADADLWLRVWVRLQVRCQHVANGTFRLRMRVGCSIDRQTRHISAHGAAGFGLKHNRKVNRHSIPASRRIRLPSCPASFLV